MSPIVATASAIVKQYRSLQLYDTGSRRIIRLESHQVEKYSKIFHIYSQGRESESIYEDRARLIAAGAERITEAGDVM